VGRADLEPLAPREAELLDDNVDAALIDCYHANASEPLADAGPYPAIGAASRQYRHRLRRVRVEDDTKECQVFSPDAEFLVRQQRPERIRPATTVVSKHLTVIDQNGISSDLSAGLSGRERGGDDCREAGHPQVIPHGSPP
jgi:hypothetical protein